MLIALEAAKTEEDLAQRLLMLFFIGSIYAAGGAVLGGVAGAIQEVTAGTEQKGQ